MPGPEPVRVQVEGLSCTDPDRVYEQIAARTSMVRRAVDGEAARSILVTLAPEDTGVVGSLRLRDDRGESDARVFHATTCEQAVAAMALAAALSIDPESADPGTSAPSAAPSVVHAADPVPAASSPPKTDAPVSPQSPSRPRDDASAIPNEARRVATQEARWSFSLGGSADAVATQGIGGDVALAPGAWLGAARSFSRHVALDARIAAQRTEGSSVSTSEGTGKPTWLTLDLIVCPFRWFDDVVAACADVQAGALQVAASGVATSSQSRSWVAPGLAGRIQWPAVSLAEGVALTADAQLGARAPVLRNTFHLLDNPSEFVVYAAPAVVAYGEIDVGVRFQ